MARSPGAPKRARKPQKPRPTKTPDANGLVSHARYSQALAARLINRLAGGDSWSKVSCEPGMPCYSSLYVWRARYPDFAEALAIAREMAADRKADRALEVAEGADAGVPGDRLRVTTLMQQAALDAPERWGGKAAAREREAEPVEIIFSVRHFERVVGPDGRAFVRQIPKEGELPEAGEILGEGGQ